MPDTADEWQRALFIPLTILAWLAVVVVAVWLLSHVTATLLTLILSTIIAFALRPLTLLLHRFMPRGLAIALSYLIGFTIILGLVAFVIVTAADQVSALASSLPTYARHLEGAEPQLVHVLHPLGVTQVKLNAALLQATSQLQSVGKVVATQSLSIIAGVVSAVVDVILVLILSVYLAIDGERLATWLRRQTPVGQRRNTTLLFAIINQVVGGYIRGTLTMAILIGVLVGAGMELLQVRYAVLLGILAFFMEFVPVLGVIVSGAISVAFALLGGWLKAVLVLGYFILVHILEGDVLGPRIVGRAVGIHPATALVALVAGTELFGIWGALFGAPLAGLLQAIGTAAWREFHGAHPDEVLQSIVQTQEVQAKVQAQQDLQAQREHQETLRGRPHD
ncbi:MAG TPA: AI-2E family transporter [Chloroflexota bacterium]|nr:AI-2E family transporter [Chloroflexota bacterium]